MIPFLLHTLLLSILSPSYALQPPSPTSSNDADRQAMKPAQSKSLPPRQAPEPVNVLVALYMRPTHRTALQRARAGLERWHMALHTATDADLVPVSPLDAPTTTMHHVLNPGSGASLDPNRFYYQRRALDPRRQPLLLTRVKIGHLAADTAAADLVRLHDLIARVPLPDRYRVPTSSCVTWVRDGVRALQDAGLVARFDTRPWLEAVVDHGEALYAAIEALDEDKDFYEIAGLRFATARYDVDRAEVVPYRDAVLPPRPASVGCRRGVAGSARRRKRCAPPLREDPPGMSFTEAFDRFAPAEYERMLPAYGLRWVQRTVERIRGVSLYAAISARLRGYTSLAPGGFRLKLRLGPVLAAAGLATWTSDMIRVFTDATANETQRLSVTASIVPVVGCLVDMASRHPDAAGHDADRDAFCLVTGAVFLTPAWPVALAVHLLRRLVEALIRSVADMKLYRDLWDPAKLQARRLAVWTERQPRIYDLYAVELRRDNVTRAMKTQLHAEAFLVLHAGAHAAAALHATTLRRAGATAKIFSSSSSSAVRADILAKNRYQGAAKLSLAMCGLLSDRIDGLRRDGMAKIQQQMLGYQTELDEQFWTWAAEFMLRLTPGVVGFLGVGGSPHRRVERYIAEQRQVRVLPAPLTAYQTERMREIVDDSVGSLAALASRCSAFCRQSEDLDCAWASCGPPPPTDDEIRDGELLHVASSTVGGDMVDDLGGVADVSDGCRSSFLNSCHQAVWLATTRNRTVHPSKLICSPKSSKAAEFLDPTREQGNNSYYQLPDYREFVDSLGP